jgi:hypothetical protein
MGGYLRQERDAPCIITRIEDQFAPGRRPVLTEQRYTGSGATRVVEPKWVRYRPGVPAVPRSREPMDSLRLKTAR